MADQKVGLWTQEFSAMGDTKILESELDQMPINNFYLFFASPVPDAVFMSTDFINNKVYDLTRRGEGKLLPIWEEYFADKQESLSELVDLGNRYRAAAKVLNIPNDLAAEANLKLRPVYKEIAKLLIERGVVRNLDELYALLSS